MMETQLVHLLLTLVYTGVGMAIFGLGFWLCAKISPFSLRKEIEEDQNTAVAIIIGAMILGLAIIIASAMH